MKKFFFLCFLSFSVWSTSAQTYTVPGAQVQPAWVFPLWFEDGTGAMDTLYFCYDPDAHYGIPYDSVFGEMRVQMDTAKFNAFFTCSYTLDFKTIKVFVTDTENLVKSVCVWKAYLPLKIKWDRNLFYSTALPFPDQLPAPSAKGGFGFDFPMVSLDPSPNCFGTLLMTDTVINAGCYATDSIVFGGLGFSLMYFLIAPWDGKEWIAGAVHESGEANNFQVYPSLFTTTLILKNEDSKKHDFKIFDLVGGLITQGEVLPYQTLSVDTENWKHGIYFLRISNENKTAAFKLFKAS